MSHFIFKNYLTEETKFLFSLWQKRVEDGESVWKGQGVSGCSIRNNNTSRKINRKHGLTSLIRWPGVVVRAQVHTFLLGYLSGQLGLRMDTGMLVITWSQSAEHTNTKKKKTFSKIFYLNSEMTKWTVHLNEGLNGGCQSDSLINKNKNIPLI